MIEIAASIDIIAIVRGIFILWLIVKLLELYLVEEKQQMHPN